MDNVLNFRTIVFMTFALGGSISAAMVYVAWRRKVYPGFQEWTLAFLTGSLGLLSISLSKYLPVFYTTVLGNVLVVTCFVLFGIGLRKFTSSRQQSWVDFFAVAVVAVCFYFFTYHWPSVVARIVVISLFISLLCLRNTLISIREIPLVLGSVNGLLTFVFGSMTLLFLVRAVATPFLTANTSNLLDTGAPQAAGVMIAGLLVAILALALILINAQRFQHDLQQSEDRYRRLIEGIKNDYYIYSHDLDGAFSYLTPSSQDLFGVAPETIVGRNWREVFQLTPEDLAKGDAADAECRNGRYPQPFEFSFPIANKGECTLETQKRPVFDNHGRVIGIEGIARDITQQKEVEKALRESEEKYRHLVENVGVGIMILQDMRFVFANNRVRQNMGLSPDASLEQADPFAFVHPDDRDLVFARQKARTRDERVSANYSFQWLLPNGHTMWLEATDVRIEWNGRPATLNFVTDITDRKHMEAERDLLIEELQAALGEVKTLTGLLPICANCKKIRDDSGYWTQVEKYIQKHSRAEFSHSICPDCIKSLYPELADRIETEKANGQNGI